MRLLNRLSASEAAGLLKELNEVIENSKTKLSKLRKDYERHLSNGGERSKNTEDMISEFQSIQLFMERQSEKYEKAIESANLDGRYN